jgi:hypothetical protein
MAFCNFPNKYSLKCIAGLVIEKQAYIKSTFVVSLQYHFAEALN